MRPLQLALIAILLATGLLSLPASARMQPDMLCFEPDFEWPLPCDEDE